MATESLTVEPSSVSGIGDQLSENDSNASETVPPMKKRRSRLYRERFCIKNSGHGLRTTHHVVVSRAFTILRCGKLFLLFISLKTRAN